MHTHARCVGWWEQYWDRQAMEGLLMTLTETTISGSGYDIVGMFTFSGELDEDKHLRMTKQYLGRHSVWYEGQYNGKDHMQGIWKLQGMVGHWEIHFREKEEGVERREQEDQITL